MGAREAHPLVERDEGVVAARHCHAILAGFFQLVAQHQAERQHDVLLVLPAARFGAAIDAAVAGIDHDQRPRIADSFRHAHGLAGLGAQGAVLHGDVAQKTLAVGGGEIEHQPRRLVPGGTKREGLVHPHRPLGVEHDARAALHDEAVAERLDQAAAVLAGLRGQLEGHLRQIDHHPIGIGEREGRQIDFLAQIHHKTRLLVVAAQAHVGSDRKRGGFRDRRQRARGHARLSRERGRVA